MDPFLKLMTKLTNPKVTVEDKLKEICITTSILIEGADRISLWSFDAKFENMHALISYDAINHIFTKDEVLKKSDSYEYFFAILNNDIISAPHARTHEITKGFNESYFIAFDIYSLLDFILHQDFNPYGVICCESVGRVSEWTDENVETIQKIARQSSMYFFKPDN